MHAPMYDALVPKVVIPVRAANSHSASMSGWPGEPSYRRTVASVSSPETMKFHIIQPVVVNQKIRSPACASTCRCSILRCSSRMPPWDWTIAFGNPVVPDEYRTHSGCDERHAVEDQRLLARRRATPSSSSPSTAVAPSPGIAPTIASSASVRSNSRPLYW